MFYEKQEEVICEGNKGLKTRNKNGEGKISFLTSFMISTAKKTS